MYPRVSQGRRALGVTIDWIACYAISLGFFAGGGSFADRVPGARFPVLLLLFAEYSILVALTGTSFGHRVVGLKVVRFSDGGPVTPLQALIRTALLLPIVTAITFDENGRGINERLSNTVLVKN
ncbi:MAG: RDD family protein [Acidobacteria bacterium]|nr:RDD family protein [Acidobacteriota bacterium]